MNAYKLQKIIRDPAFLVMLPLALIITPHIPRLPLWMPFFIYGLFGLRLGAILSPSLLPRSFLLLLIAVMAGIGTIMHYGTVFGKLAGTAILICLLAIKLLESRQLRDYMLLIALGFFVIVTNFLFTQTIPTALYMLLTVVILVTSLISLHQGDANLSLRWRLHVAAKLVAWALPLMLIMFVFFPRLPGPLWQLPDDAKSGRSGLSDTMSPGNIAKLMQSDEVAFRVEFSNHNKPAQQQLYWRALVLWQFDGRSWQQGSSHPATKSSLEILSRPIDYTITLEPHDKNWLFALDIPTALPESVGITNNFLLRSKDNITSLYRYSLQSALSYRINEQLSLLENSNGLAYPAQRNPRSIALAQQWRQQLAQDDVIVERALTLFNQENFVYTLEPDTLDSINPVDEFLFETRRGFCEHYASSFALLMRAAGIPARVILGYQGGTVNPLNQVLTVRQSDAHAWTEVWLQHRGWVRIDPTAAIAPNRIEQNLNAALAANETRPLYMRIDQSILRQLKFYWDAADNRWKQWVIGYGPALQQQLMQAWFGRDIRYDELTLILVTGVSSLLLLFTWLAWRRKNPLESDPTQRLYNRFCARLAQQGVVREPSEGPLDFATRVQQLYPDQKNTIELITKIYITSRYRSRNQPELIDKMRLLIRDLKFPATR